MSGVSDKTREIVQDLTGMWWPDADEGKLRDAARAWRTFADAVEKLTGLTNNAARSVIEHNKGESIEAFDVFWRRYYHDGRGWLKDLSDGARDMGSGLDKYADSVADAKKKLEHELEIVGATIVVGTGLAFFTAGVTEVAAGAATVTILDLAGTLGVAVSAEVATIAGTVLATAAIGGIEAVTVDLAVAQPMRMAAGLQTGINLDEARHAAIAGAMMGGGLGGTGAAYQAIRNAGGIPYLFKGVVINVGEPQFALAGSGMPFPGPLLREGETNAWPRAKRKGPTQPKHRADVAGDEGKNGSHTLARHAEVTTRDLRTRLRAEPNLDVVSRYVDEASAQKFTDAAMLKQQRSIEAWLAGSKRKLELAPVHFDDPTGMSLTRGNFRNGLPAEWVHGVQVVLKRDPAAESGYRILTSYPIPK
ncbi:RNase A-like domain-containing protein [Streptomyces sp. NPDC050738]|uniref:RNase A-like domain-containing protein n=1 Tax=Streptomyces sp. NPDC050738 TaxID=3154744 RepID=UPI00343DDFE4